jgi:hypothetical protein
MKSKTNTKVLTWSVIVALGRFLFGFDTAVISSVEKHIQELFHGGKGISLFSEGGKLEAKSIKA